MSIHTRFLPPTNHLGARVKATTASGKTFVVAWDDAISSHENHMRAAAKALAALEDGPRLDQCRTGESESGCGYTVTWRIAYTKGASNV